MSQHYSAEFLYRLRNEIPINTVIRVLQWPHKQRDGYFRFLCPHCGEFNTATYAETNLGSCFHCKANFNTIDFVIRVQSCDFLEAVDYLTPLLSSTPTSRLS